MPVDLVPAPGAAPRKEWTVTGRFVLVSLVLFFLVVASVNGIMMSVAIGTFPGADARNGYETSQAFNKEIAAARQQAERGWASDIAFQRVDGMAELTVTLKDRTGQPVSGLEAEARLKHPSDRKQDHVVTLREIAPGIYRSREAGVSSGAWGLSIVAQKNGERVYVANSRTDLKS